MKKEKITLSKLKIESFVTSINNNSIEALKGGIHPTTAAFIALGVGLAGGALIASALACEKSKMGFC